MRARTVSSAAWLRLGQKKARRAMRGIRYFIRVQCRVRRGGELRSTPSKTGGEKVEERVPSPDSQTLRAMDAATQTNSQKIGYKNHHHTNGQNHLCTGMFPAIKRACLPSNTSFCSP